jgi:putative ABC transport system ATP-binding protein
MLLKLVNVSKVYRPDSLKVHALKNINLEIKKGEFVALMGPSGSGKSTLMHIAGCLDTPTTGKVIFDGKKVGQLSEKALAKIRNEKIGFVFQSFNLIPRTTAQDNVSLPLFYADKTPEKSKKIAGQALKRVGLEERMDHFPNQLSGGEQQRVAIARALVNNPLVIFADEPTGNLDTKTGEEIMAIFRQLNRKGHTVVIVTHEMAIAKSAKRTVRIKDGVIVKKF